MNIDREAFKALAESANAVTGDVRVDVTITSDAGPNQAEIDAVTAFMGMATPAAILALLAQIDLLKAENQCRVRQVERLVDEAESLRQNADRYLVLRQADVDTVHTGGLFAGLVPENMVINGEDLDQRADAAIEEQRAFVHAVLNQPLYTCHACKAATPYPEPYRMYVKCACGETTAVTAALAGHADFGVFAWLYVKASNGAIQLSRSKQHAPGNWVENDGYSINPLYEGPEVPGVTPDAWAFRTLRDEPGRDWKLSVIYPLTACEPGHLEVKALYKREHAPSS